MKMHRSMMVTGFSFIAIIGAIVVIFLFMNSGGSQVDYETAEDEPVVEQMKYVPGIGPHVFWDIRNPMLGFLEVADDNTYGALISAVSYAAEDARFEAFGYGNRKTIRPIKLDNKEIYQEENLNSPHMVKILGKMKENLGSATLGGQLEVLVTCTWYDKTESIYNDGDNKVKQAMVELLNFKDGKNGCALLWLKPSWNTHSKVLFVLVVGEQKRVFDFCNDVINRLAKENITPGWVMNDYWCPEPLFSRRSDNDSARRSNEDSDPIYYFPMTLLKQGDRRESGIYLESAEIRKSNCSKISISPTGDPTFSVGESFVDATIAVDIPYRCNMAILNDYRPFLPAIGPKITKIYYTIDDGDKKHVIPFPKNYESGDLSFQLKFSLKKRAGTNPQKCTVYIELENSQEANARSFHKTLEDAQNGNYRSLEDLFLADGIAEKLTSDSSFQTVKFSFQYKGEIKGEIS